MAFTFKQGIASNPSMGGGTTATATITPTAGSLLVCIVQSVDSRTLTAVSDNVNGAWTSTGLTRQVSSGSNTDLHPPFFFPNTSGSALTVTITLNATSSTLWILLLEYSGIATSSPFDAGGGNADAGSGIQTLAVPASPVTMVAQPELWLAVGWASALANRDFGAVSGWTHDVDSTNSNAGPYFSAFSQESSSGTSLQITLTTAPNNQFMDGFVMGFKESSSGVTGTASVAVKPGITASGNSTTMGTANVALKPSVSASGSTTGGIGTFALIPRILGQGAAGQVGVVAFVPRVTASGQSTPPVTGPGPTVGGGQPSTKIWPFASHREGPKVVTRFVDGKPVTGEATPAPPSAPVGGGQPKRPVRRRRADLSPKAIAPALPPLVPVVPPPPLQSLVGQQLPPVKVPSPPKAPETPPPPPPPKPKKVVLVTRYWGGLGLAMQLQRQGSDLVVATDYRTVPAKERQATEQIGHGLVPRLPLDQVKTLVKGDDVLWVFDSNDLPKEADALRDAGELVIGTSELSARLEEDREFGTEMAEAVGFDLPVTEQFYDYDQAVQYLEAHPDQAFVFKPDAQDPTATYVPLEKEDAAKANEELQEYLRSVQSSNPSFILQEVVNGVEANFECWVANGIPLVGFCDLESKRKLVGDLGENLGCAGDYVFTLGLDSPALAETVFRYLGHPKLRGYTGSVDANVMLKDGKVYFLENCFRFGYNAYGTIFQALATGRVEDILRGWVNGDELPGAFKPGFGASLTLVCDHPKDGTPILLPKENEDNLYLYRAWCDRDHCAMVEEWPEVAAVTAYGETMEQAGALCLDRAKQVTFPGKGYRIDLASEDLPTLPIPRYRALQDMGWVPGGQEFRDVESILAILEAV